MLVKSPAAGRLFISESLNYSDLDSSAITKLIIIDPSVEHYDLLMSGLAEDAIAHVLDANKDGVEQITHIIHNVSFFAATSTQFELHIISHGAPGCLYLGNQALSLHTLKDYAPQIQQWFAPWSNASLKLYACHAAAGETGQEFLMALKSVAGVPVAGSTTSVGKTGDRTNWSLDVSTNVTGDSANTLPIHPETLASYPGSLDRVNPSITLQGGNAAPGNGSTSWNFTNGEISDANTTNPSQGDAFDGVLEHSVGGTTITDADSSVERTIYSNGSVALTYDPVVVNGLNVQLQYFLDNSLPIARSIITLSNPTASAITVNYSLLGNLGSDGDTQLLATSSGDTTYSNVDRWVVSDDASTVGNDPGIVTALYGNGATLTPDASSTFGSTYEIDFANLNIPANSTVSLLFFTSLSNTGAAAVTLASTFNSSTGVRPLLDGLSFQEIADIKNWDFSDLRTGRARSPIDFSGGRRGTSLSGNSRDNRLTGTTRNDSLRGEGGDDTLVGDDGNDVLRGDAGADNLRGGDNNDRLYGGSDNDVIAGGNNDDLLEGGSGNDKLQGDRGNDILVGGSGVDTLTGGSGRDTFKFERLTDGRDSITDFSIGNDLIDLRDIFARAEFQGGTAFERLAQFVEVVQVGTSSRIRIDADGSEPGTTFVELATLRNINATELTERSFVIA